MFYPAEDLRINGASGKLTGEVTVAAGGYCRVVSSTTLQPYMRSNPGCIQEEGMFGPFGDGDDDD